MRSGVGRADACLNVIVTASLDTGAGPASPGASSTRSGCGRRERAVGQVARVATRQRRVAGGRITFAVVRRRVLARHARHERAEASPARPSVSDERRGHRAAGAAGRVGRVLAGELVARRHELRRRRGDRDAAAEVACPGASTTGSRSCRSLTPTDCCGRSACAGTCESCASSSSLSTWPGWTVQACGCSWKTCLVGPAPTPSGRWTPRAISRCGRAVDVVQARGDHVVGARDGELGDDRRRARERVRRRRRRRPCRSRPTRCRRSTVVVHTSPEVNAFDGAVPGATIVCAAVAVERGSRRARAAPRSARGSACRRR